MVSQQLSPVAPNNRSATSCWATQTLLLSFPFSSWILIGVKSLEDEDVLRLTIWPPVWRCCWWNMAESRDIPLLDQYLLENIIMAGCILGTGSRLGFSTWEEAMGNQWV